MSRFAHMLIVLYLYFNQQILMNAKIEMSLVVLNNVIILGEAIIAFVTLDLWLTTEKHAKVRFAKLNSVTNNDLMLSGLRQFKFGIAKCYTTSLKPLKQLDAPDPVDITNYRFRTS